MYDGDESDANGKRYYKNVGIYGFEKPCARPKFNSWSLNVSTNVVSCGLDVE